MKNFRRAILATALCSAAVALPGAAAFADSYTTPDSGITSDKSSVDQGGTVVFSAQGFAPGSTVELWLGDTKLGDFTADVDGRVEMTVSVPSDLADGVYTFEARGTDPAGDPMVLDLAVAVGDGGTGPVTGATLIIPAVLGAGAAAAGAMVLRINRRRAGI